MAGIESWASSIMLYELAEKLQRPAISKDLVYKWQDLHIKRIKWQKSGGVALLPVSSRLLDIDHFASYRVNAGH